jgi:hypothetical protein
MSDQTSQTPLFINSCSIYAGAEMIKSVAASGTLASTSWGTANRAEYFPVWLPWPYVVRRVFWCNGSVASGNTDFGIYTSDGTKIYSTGSTAQSGASAIQYVTPTEFTLASGVYYFAVVFDGTTNRAFGLTSNTIFGSGGQLVQTSALPLPATATFAATAGTPHALCGITRTASGF